MATVESGIERARRFRHLAKVGSPRKAAGIDQAYRGLPKSDNTAPTADVRVGGRVPLGFSAAAPSDRREAIAALAAPLIKRFEGFREHAYLDELAKPPVWTVGYGTTRVAGSPVYPGMNVTHEEAENYLISDMSWAITVALALDHAYHIRTKERMTEAQCAAIASFAYNVGASLALKSPSVAGRIRAGDLDAAADGLLKYVKAGGKTLRGLQRRRTAERALFLSDALGDVVPADLPHEPPDASRAAPDRPEKPLVKSTRIWAQISMMFGAFLTFMGEKIGLLQQLSGLSDIGTTLVLVIVFVGAGYAIAEQRRRHQEGSA